MSADEVELTYKEIHEYPVNPPTGVLRAEDVTVTRIPFTSMRDSKGASVGGTSGQEE